MKRSEVTVENLKAMGYKAYMRIPGWMGRGESEISNKENAVAVFDLVVANAKSGREVNIIHDIVRWRIDIIAFVKEMKNGPDVTFYLSRPMNEKDVERYCKKYGFEMRRA